MLYEKTFEKKQAKIGNKSENEHRVFLTKQVKETSFELNLAKVSIGNYFRLSDLFSEDPTVG